jgi:endonuclease G, mitochondrial
LPAPRSDGAARTIGGTGYDPRFIGVSLPVPTAASAVLRNDLVGAAGTRIAHYTHFSLSMRKSRRLAAYVAWNIDGRITKPADSSATWQLDPRVPAEYQIDNSLYEGTVFDRGHIAKREDLLWGGDSVAERANDDSFCYTNATPQHAQFNRVAPALWKSLENEIFRQVNVADLRIALVGGPIFAPDDRPFVPAGAAAGTAPVRIPRQFFKVAAYRDEADGRVKALAFRLSQADLVAGDLDERLDLSRFEMFQVTVAELERLTGLRMTAFRRADVKAAVERLTAAAAAQPARPLQSFADVVR